MTKILVQYLRGQSRRVVDVDARRGGTEFYDVAMLRRREHLGELVEEFGDGGVGGGREGRGIGEDARKGGGVGEGEGQTAMGEMAAGVGHVDGDAVVIDGVEGGRGGIVPRDGIAL